ncbi:Taxadien-5-alpha-ol O-acetyltransferase [Bertholletia excelsa]
MEVKILETATVHPSTPPCNQDHVLALSHIDNDRNLQVTFRYFRPYVSTTTDPFTPSHRPLRRPCPLLPPRRNSSTPPRGRPLVLHCAVGAGVPLIRASVDCSLESVKYLDDPAQSWIENLVPNSKPDEVLAHPMILQVTVFACGGYRLGLRFSTGCRVGSWGRVSVEPVWDRERLLGPRDPPQVDFPVHEFLKLDKGSSPVCFPATEEQLDRFKGFLRQLSGSSFTRLEALGAFIWRARVRASAIPGDEKVKFAYSVNIRKLMKPPLPDGYWGNGCVALYVQLGARNLVEQPIWETAELIKRSKRNATDEYVRSFVDFQDFTDWRHLGHSTVDFGSGGPVTVLPLSRNLLGGSEPSFFLPYSKAAVGKDGFRVLVHLKETAVPAFRAAMEKFCAQKFYKSVAKVREF